MLFSWERGKFQVFSLVFRSFSEFKVHLFLVFLNRFDNLKNCVQMILSFSSIGYIYSVKS